MKDEQRFKDKEQLSQEDLESILDFWYSLEDEEDSEDAGGREGSDQA